MDRSNDERARLLVDSARILAAPPIPGGRESAPAIQETLTAIYFQLCELVDPATVDPPRLYAGPYSAEVRLAILEEARTAFQYALMSPLATDTPEARARVEEVITAIQRKIRLLRAG